MNRISRLFNVDFLQGPIIRSLVIFAIPLFVSSIFQQMYSMVDTMIIGNYLGDEALAAMGACASISDLLVGFCLGVGSGLSVVIARSYGSGNEKQVKKSVAMTIILSALVTGVISGFGSLILKPILELLNTPAEIIDQSYSYVSTIMAGALVTLAYNVCAGMLRAIGNSVMPLLFLIVASVLNVALDVVFISEFHMGVRGAAVATVSGQWVAAIMALIFNFTRNPDVQLKLKYMLPRKDIVGKILTVGIPSIIMMAIGSVMNFGMNQILLGFKSYGETAAGVFGIYFKLQSFVLMPLFGLNNASISIIAYNYGARQPKRITKTLKLAVGTAMTIMLVGLTVFQVFPNQLLGIFEPSDTFLSLGRSALRVISFHFPLAAVGIALSSSFQAMGNGIYSTIVSLCRQLVALLPAAYLLSLTGDVHAVWWSFPIAEVVSMIVSLIFFARIYKQKIKPLSE